MGKRGELSSRGEQARCLVHGLACMSKIIRKRINRPSWEV